MTKPLKTTFLTILFLLIGAFIVQAAAPSGGYGPGDTLNPDCSPGDTDCTVNLGWDRDGTNSYTYNTTDSIGIGTATPDASAILDLTSTTQGLLVPRNSDPASNISSPAEGLIAYDTTDDQLQGYVNSAWAPLLNNIVEDVTPQLGGDLDYNDNRIKFDALPSSDHSAVGPFTDIFNASEAIAVGQLVYLNSSGEWATDSHATINTFGPALFGIALESIGGSGTPIEVALPGSFVRDDSWSWTAGDDLYTASSSGAITTTKVVISGTNYVFRIGTAVSADVIFFNPQIYVETNP